MHFLDPNVDGLPRYPADGSGCRRRSEFKRVQEGIRVAFIWKRPLTCRKGNKLPWQWDTLSKDFPNH